MKIHVQKPTEVLVGALRVDASTYGKLKKLAEREGVSIQVIIRSILKETIDTVE